MREAGAMTLGQDVASAVVYGMCKVANDIGAVEKQLPLEKIAAAVMAQCKKQSTVP
jgi:two-component system chemotaxis response regulator CheB